MKNKEGNILSFKILIDSKGNLVTELSGLLEKDARKIFNKEDLPIIERDIKAKNLWTPAGIMKVFLNSYIRGGEKIQNARKITDFFGKYYEAKLDKKIASVRSEAGKKKWEKVKKTGVLEYNKYKRDLYFVIASYISLQTAKTMVLQKLNRAENIGTFIKTSNGYRVTAPEGFVAIDRIGRALKLVDRLEFSRANFTANSSWK